MQDYTNPYATPYSVASQSANVRAEFIKKTYLHLAGAIGLFILIETALMTAMSSAMKLKVAGMMTGGFSWLIVMGLFMGVSMLANKWAMSNTSKTTQYLGLGLYVAAWSVIFIPILVIATMNQQFLGKGIIMNAALITIALTVGISVVAYTTKKDFSFLGGFLRIGGFIALGAIVLSICFGFTLGILFSAIMVVFASVSILHETSNIIHHYNTNQYVAASLGLFSSIALLFWYLIQILMSLASD